MKKHSQLTFILLLTTLFIAVPVRAAFLTLVQGYDEVPTIQAVSYGLALDPSEQYLYVSRNPLSSGDAAFEAVEVYRRDFGTGLLTLVDEEFNVSEPETVAVSPDGKHVYVDSLDATLDIFQRNSDGTLNFIQTVTNDISFARDMAFHPNGTRLYMTDELGALRVFARDANTGLLTLLQTLTDNTNDVDGLASPETVAVSSDGAHVYVASRGDNAVTVFKVIGGQLLEFVETQNSDLIGLKEARDVDISPDGKYVYVFGYNTTQNKGAIGIFSRDSSTGHLTYADFVQDGLNGVELPSLRWMAISPDGQHLYVGTSVFARNSTTGALSFVERGTDQGGVYRIVVSSDSRDVYMSIGLATSPLVLFYSTNPPPVNQTCLTVTTISLFECNALAILFNSTNGSNWTNNTGWLANNNPCTWYGVTCASGHVTELNLPNNNLEGTIPPKVSDLPYLVKLYLNGNPKLKGVLPASLTNLTQLNTFYFNNTNLVESPSSAFQNWLNGIADVQSTGKIGSLVYLPLIVK